MGKILLVSYDLRMPGRDYDRLIDHLESDYESSISPLESVWLIKTTDSPSEVIDTLENYIDENDRLLVIDITDDNWAGFNLDDEAVEWMKANL